MTSTIFRLGYTNPLTDQFGAHPRLGPVLDLNDGVTYTLTTPDGVELPPPPRTLVTAGNIRTQGERATRAIYHHNRQVVARVLVGPMNSASDLITSIRALVAWLSAPPSLPLTIQYQPIGATQPVYLDVVGAAHDIPEDESEWLRLQFEPVELIFIARPGLRGDRVTLQNDLVNPGFEAPSGPAIPVFSDPFTSAQAYATLTGSAPTAANNLLSLPAGTQITFGSPAWSAINTWTLRFTMPSGSGGLNAYLHYADANNWLRVNILSTGLTLQHSVAGSIVAIATSAALTTTAGLAYWLIATQFPTVPGDPAYVKAALYADNSGAQGALVTNSSIAAATQEINGVGQSAGLTGLMSLQNASAATISIGGSYTNVHTVSLFGPSGWYFTSGGGAYAQSSGAWEQSAANLFTGGPVASFGAARIDVAPAGELSAYWLSADGANATSIQNTALPSAPTITYGVSIWLRSSGVSATCNQTLSINEYDATGHFLRGSVIASVMNAQPTWTQLSGQYTTGTSCAYIQTLIRAQDTTAGASAGGSIWLENAQLWNTAVTPNGATMPYCELRFSQSPAQLVVSGLLGDLPAPAYLALGSYLTSWAKGATLAFAIGRRGQISTTARLAAPSVGYYGAAFSPTSVAALDSASYGGYYIQATVGNGWNPRAFSLTAADAPGVYHIFGRFLTQQAQPNLANISLRAATTQGTQPWYGAADFSTQLGQYYAPYSYPLTASNAWTITDAGQIVLPPFNQGPLADPTQTYLTPHQQWADLTSGGSICQMGWQLLLPVDGSLLTGLLNNPTNAPASVANRWLWAYIDGLGDNLGLPAANAYSLESAPLPNPAHAGGGPGSQSSGSVNINLGADPFLTLDPQQQISGAGSVNQLAAYITDGAGAVLPLYAEIQYSPLYLYPR